MPIEDTKLECHVKLGGKYLREIRELADAAFNDDYLDAKLNRKEMVFEVWLTSDKNKIAITRFEEKYKSCKIRVFEEKKKSKV